MDYEHHPPGRNMNITVYAETSASIQVTEEIASELHEFRISVRRGRISLDVTWAAFVWVSGVGRW